MKRVPTLCILLLSFILIIQNFGIIGLQGSNQNTTIHHKDTWMTRDNTNMESNPIEIDGNEELATLAHSGSGSKSDPYFLSNLTINAVGSNSGIYIKNTDKHVRITNCRVSGAGIRGGIVLSECRNVHIVNCTLRNNGDYGIDLFTCVNNTLINNTITNNYGGIHLVSSMNITLINNLCMSNSDDGISLYASSCNTIDNNTATKNNIYGVSASASTNNTFIRMTITKNWWGGIYLTSSSFNVFTNNSISDNEDDGVTLSSSSQNTFIYNDIRNNWAGIWLYGSSDNNIIQYNDFIDNFPHALDDGAGNVFDYNYWDDHIRPDADGDGIVDEKYNIGGSAGNYDSHPRTYFSEITTIASFYTAETSNSSTTETTAGINVIVVLTAFIISLCCRRKSKL